MVRLLLLGLILIPAICTAQTSSVSHWHLPQPLTDNNTTVRFEVDSTWHTVHGTTSKVSGAVSLEKETDPTSVIVTLKVPVSSFDTDNSMRDERMNEVMSSDDFPFVSFVGQGLTKNCTPALVLRDGNCADELHGYLTIRDTKKEVSIPITIKKVHGKKGESDAFQIHGDIPLRWGEFQVEDPSILIARLNPVVTISFDVSLTPQHFVKPQEG